MKLLRLILIILLLLFGLWIISFHEEILSYYNKLYGPADERPVLAEVVDPQGKVRYKLPRQLIYRNVNDGLELREQDSISTDQNSSLQIQFKDGLELLVEENSLIVIEKLGASNQEGLKISFLRGNFKVLKSGTPGVNTLIKNSKDANPKEDIVIDPAGRVPAKPIIITAKPDTNFQNLLKKTQAPDVPADAQDLLSSKIEAPPIKENIKAQKLEEKESNRFAKNKIVKREDKETLPDNYIVDVIKKQKAFFNRCYAQHLRVNPEAQGRIDFSFTISPNGKVSDVRVLRSSIADTRLQQCSMSVIERAEFRSFDGDPIVVNYPIHYE